MPEEVGLEVALPIIADLFAEEVGGPLIAGGLGEAGLATGVPGMEMLPGMEGLTGGLTENPLGTPWGDFSGSGFGGEPTGMWGGATGMQQAGQGSMMDSILGPIGQSYKKNPGSWLLGGLGAGMMGLSAMGASKQRQQQNEQSRQLREDQARRQAIADNPLGQPLVSSNLDPHRLFTRNVSPQNMDPQQMLQEYQGSSTPERRSQVQYSARGGLSALKSAGHASEPSRMGLLDGPGGGQDDMIHARLSPGEYVFDAETVSHLGDGNPQEGARKLDKMRAAIRTHKRSAPASSIPAKAKAPEQYLKVKK